MYNELLNWFMAKFSVIISLECKLSYEYVKDLVIIQNESRLCILNYSKWQPQVLTQAVVQSIPSHNIDYSCPVVLVIWTFLIIGYDQLIEGVLGR